MDLYPCGIFSLWDEKCDNESVNFLSAQSNPLEVDFLSCLYYIKLKEIDILKKEKEQNTTLILSGQKGRALKEIQYNFYAIRCDCVTVISNLHSNSIYGYAI